MEPTVTILMPVHNGEKYLQTAINSILNQTFADYEFIIIDDCSTDSSWDIMNSYKDKRIRLFRNKKRGGASITRNIGLKLSNGEYIALMDADDLSMPNRLAYQVSFMKSRPDIGICGTWARSIGKEKRIMRCPVRSDDIRIGLLFNNCFINTSVILRNEYFKRHNLLFKPFIEPAEDYELWVRCSKLFNMGNIPKVLVNYRVHEKQASNQKKDKQALITKSVREGQVKSLGLNASEEELALFNRYAWQNYDNVRQYLFIVETWLFKLMTANNEVHQYPDLYFKNYLATKFLVMHHYLNSHGFFVCNLFSNASYFDSNLIDWKNRLLFRLRGISGLINTLIGVLFWKHN
jgi:glycosyltransferase involved in cell wall biosynthesis